MSRMLGVFFAMTVATASMALAQGGGGGGMGGGAMGGGRMAPPDHWITGDSLAKAVGGNAALAGKVAPHLAEQQVLRQPESLARRSRAHRAFESGVVAGSAGRAFDRGA